MATPLTHGQFHRQFGYYRSRLCLSCIPLCQHYVPALLSSRLLSNMATPSIADQYDANMLKWCTSPHKQTLLRIVLMHSEIGGNVRPNSVVSWARDHGLAPKPQPSRARLYASLRDEDVPISWEDDVSLADEPKVGSADSHTTSSIPDQNFSIYPLLVFDETVLDRRAQKYKAPQISFQDPTFSIADVAFLK